MVVAVLLAALQLGAVLRVPSTCTRRASVVTMVGNPFSKFFEPRSGKPSDNFCTRCGVSVDGNFCSNCGAPRCSPQAYRPMPLYDPGVFSAPGTYGPGAYGPPDTAYAPQQPYEEGDYGQSYGPAGDGQQQPYGQNPYGQPDVYGLPGMYGPQGNYWPPDSQQPNARDAYRPQGTYRRARPPPVSRRLPDVFGPPYRRGSTMIGGLNPVLREAPLLASLLSTPLLGGFKSACAPLHSNPSTVAAYNRNLTWRSR